MALYQFYLALIPKQGIMDKFGIIPQKLFIDVQERNEHFLMDRENLIDESDQFKDALLQDWWHSVKIQPIELIHQIDKKVKRANWGNNETSIYWKTYNHEMDNDALFSINPTTGKIKELSFRADLREKDLTFLKEMIKLAEKYDCLLMDYKGNLAQPTFEEIIPLLKASNAFRFLTDPVKFFDDFNPPPQSSL